MYESDVWVKDFSTIDGNSWKQFAGTFSDISNIQNGPDMSLEHPKYLYIKHSFPAFGSPKYYSFIRYSETSAIGKGFKIEANGNARFNNVVLNGANLNNINQYIITNTGTEVFGCISQGCKGMKKWDRLIVIARQSRGLDGTFRAKITISVSSNKPIEASQIKGTIYIGMDSMGTIWGEQIKVDTASYSTTVYCLEARWGGYLANNHPQITYESDIDYADNVKIQMHVTFMSDIERGTYAYDQLCNKIHYRTLIDGTHYEFCSWWTKLNGDGTFLAYKEYAPQARLSDRSFTDFQPVNWADDINKSVASHYFYHRVKVSHYGNYYMTANVRLPGNAPYGDTEIDNFITVSFGTIPINYGTTDLFRFDIELTGDWYDWRSRDYINSGGVPINSVIKNYF